MWTILPGMRLQDLWPSLLGPVRWRGAVREARAWRPGVRAWVLAGSALVVIGLAFPIAGSAADHLRDASRQSATANAESIVRSYVDPILDGSSLDLGVAPNPDVQEQLSRLVAGREMRRVNVWTRDGRIMYSTEPELRGVRFDIDAELARAFAGTSEAYFGIGAGDEQDVGSLPPSFLEIYVPIRGASDGNPIGVFEVYVDAGPIQTAVAKIRGDVFLFTLGAGAILLALLWLAFSGTSRLLSSQNRRLVQMNSTLNQLADDLRHREARFRSLVQNSSDVVVVISPEGLVSYESDGIRKVLGHDPADAVGRRFDERVHPEEVGWIRSLFAGLVGSRGAEQTTELRLRHADGSWRWVEAIGQNLTHEPAVAGVVLNFRDITDRRRLEDQLQHEAFHDPLTGLANRALFADRVTHALTRTRRHAADRLAVLFVDLDEFKVVNDSLGHASGDELLTAVAERIRACLRREDTAARLGGDEFGILLEEADADIARDIAERIHDALGQPFALDARQLFIQASIGIALSGQRDGGGKAETADELLRNADAAMYTAKSHGKGRHEFFETRMHTSALLRLELRGRLEAGLERGELVVQYQPVVELVSGAVVGAEALVRWRQPDGGLAPPSEFVPLAEETGLIVALGQYVLDTACREAAAWSAVVPGQPLSVAVNVSSRQLQESGFAASVAATIARSRLPPEQLVVEVTESALLDDGDVTSESIMALKALGVRIALDDFGTGYSSLSHLRRFPIDVLKIDRSFVNGIDGGDQDERTLVRSIVRLAHSLKLETVAEGVERAEQLVQLRAIGARMGQGFYFARPMEASAFIEHVRGEVRAAG